MVDLVLHLIEGIFTTALYPSVKVTQSLYLSFKPNSSHAFFNFVNIALPQSHDARSIEDHGASLHNLSAEPYEQQSLHQSRSKFAPWASPSWPIRQDLITALLPTCSWMRPSNRHCWVLRSKIPKVPFFWNQFHFCEPGEGPVVGACHLQDICRSVVRLAWIWSLRIINFTYRLNLVSLAFALTIEPIIWFRKF